jgi:phage terminase large subunit-like protein
VIADTRLAFEPAIDAAYDYDYSKIVGEINALAEAGDEKRLIQFMRFWCQESLFFIAYFVLRIPVNHPFLIERIKEVQSQNDRTLDLWSREFFKSSIITYALNVQNILVDPDVRIGIFSHTRNIAKAFLRRIKITLESNDVLKTLFPDILYENPSSQSPKWALDVNTKILTMDGWKDHGDLQVGDKIFGSNGQVITVIGNSGPMMGLPCRRVQFDDCELVASADHLWPIKRKTGQRWDTFELINVTTDELPIRDKYRHSPPTPIIHPEVSTMPPMLDPYVLGLWLGDGTAGTNIISMHRDDEDEVLSQLELLGFNYYIHRRNPDDNFSMYGIEDLKMILSMLGCLKDKHVPNRYWLGSKLERLSLLQGLMDSDGTCKHDASSGGMCQFCNTNWKLAFAVFYLTTSLGLRPNIYAHNPGNGNKIIYRVYFVGIKSIPPFRLRRKLDKCNDSRHQTGRYIRSIGDIESVPVNCIKVDAEDGIYLAGYNLVQTHNSEDEGLIVKRSSVFQECTVEAWGLTDGQPTSKHFPVLNYDDVVTVESVSTPAQIKKTSDCFRLSMNLGTDGGKKRVIGTIYHYADLHMELEQQGGWIVRKRPAEDTHGKPTFLSAEKLAEKRRDQGPYVYACQMLLSPVTKKDQRFRPEWLRYYRTLPTPLSLYLICDPSNEKKKKLTGGDYTVYWLWGLDSYDNLFLVDCIRDRLILTERWKALKEMRRRHPGIQRIGYEQYGMAADIQHYEEMMLIEGVYFNILELGGNKLSKEDRIARMIPLFEQGRVYLPEQLPFEDKEGKEMDLVQVFKDEEYLRFPFSQHDDMLDAASRIEDKALEVSKPSEDWSDEDSVGNYGLHGYFGGLAGIESLGRCPITGY